MFNNELRDLQQALSKERTGEIYNIGNISKDDAESIINMLKDYVTLKIGNGKELKMPKLNLEMLPNNFPEDLKSKISAKLNEGFQMPSAVSGIDKPLSLPSENVTILGPYSISD